MGWKWTEETEENTSNSSSSDEIANPNANFGSMDEGESDRCATRRVIRSNCTTEEVEPGKFVRKCEKTEQTLRECIGRPVEVVESHTEQTEEDVTHQMKSGNSFSLQLPTENHPFSFPGLQNDMEAIEREFMGGLDDFLKETEKMTNGLFKEAEKMTNDWFKSFGLQREQGDKVARYDSPKKDDSVYSEFAGKITDV